MAQVKKISVAKLCGKIEAPKPGELRAVCTILGIADGFRLGESTYGEYTALLGRFRGINLKGEMSDAAVCFLPDVALDPIVRALNTQGENVSIQFGYSILVRGDATSKTGYVYEVESLVEQSSDDPMNVLTSNVQKRLEDATNQKRLEAVTLQKSLEAGKAQEQAKTSTTSKKGGK